MFLFDTKTKEERGSAKHEKEVLEKVEKFFKLEKTTLVKSKMPTYLFIQLANTPFNQRKKEEKTGCLRLLGLDPSDKNLQRIDDFLATLDQQKK